LLEIKIHTISERGAANEFTREYTHPRVELQKRTLGTAITPKLAYLRSQQKNMPPNTEPGFQAYQVLGAAYQATKFIPRHSECSAGNAQRKIGTAQGLASVQLARIRTSDTHTTPSPSTSAPTTRVFVLLSRPNIKTGKVSFSSN